MPVQDYLAGGPDWTTNLGSLLTGASEVVTVIAAGVGFLIRTRRNSNREKQRIAESARKAAEDTKAQLEAKIEESKAAEIAAKDAQLAEQRLIIERLLKEEHDRT
jgi:hypothetical protein